MVFEEVITFQSNILVEIGVIIILATLLAYITKLIRQPLIPAYIVAGLILGPIGLNLVTDMDVTRALSEIGIIFLLFIIGVEIDLTNLKKVGAVTMVTGIVQVLLTFGAGFLAGFLLGWDPINSIYAGLVLAFSSTMIVVKLLSDENEVETLHGRIIIGILFLQDLFVILALSIVGTQAFDWNLMILSVLKGFSLVALAFVFNALIVRKLFKFAARSEELLFLLSISVCFFFAMLAYIFDFSIAIGAFLGGLTLANLPYNLNIISRINPLKDFFATIFFVTLGIQIIPTTFSDLLIPLVVFLGITLLIKPLIIFLSIVFFGYGKKIAFISAASLAQISEFSLILVMAAQDIISQELFTTTIILSILTITFTTYIIKYEHWFFKVIERPLQIFDIFEKKGYKDLPPRKSKEYVLFGCHRIGMHLIKQLPVKKTLVVDYNPDTVHVLKRRGMDAIYGDVGNIDVLKHLNFKKAKIVISTVPNERDNMQLVKFLRENKYKGLLFVTGNHLHDALSLYETGADYVIVPQVMAGHAIEDVVKKLDRKKLQKMRKEHIKTILDIDAESNPKKLLEK